MYINRVTIFGNLTKNPELRALPSGGNVCSFGIATNRQFKKPDGTKQETTEFHTVVVFGKQAESCAQYLKKGDTAYIEGRLQTRSWDGERGKQYRTEVVADRVQFGPRPRSKGEDDVDQRPAIERAADPTTEPNNGYPEEDIDLDSIPF